MQREQILAAVCGTQRIVVALVHREADGRFHVADATALPVLAAPSTLASTNPPEDRAPWVETLRHALRERRWRTPVARLVVAPPTETVLLKTARTPDLPPVQRTAVLRFEAEQALPFALGELAWVAARTGRDGEDVEHTIAAVKRDTLDPLAALVADHRRGGCLVPLALALAAALPSDSCTGTAWRLHVFTEATATLLVARVGGRTVLRAIVHPPAEAAARLAAEVARAVAVVRRQLGVDPPGEVELSGPAALAHELALRLQEKFGGTPHLFAVTNGTTPRTELAPVELAGVLALAELALGPDATALDLTPATIRAEARLRRVRPAGLALAATLAVGALAWTGALWMNVQSTKATAHELAARIAPLRKLDRQRRAQQAALHERRQELAALDAVGAARTHWAELLALLDEQVTRESGLWLEGVEAVPGAEPAPANPLPRPLLAPAGQPALRVRIHGAVTTDAAAPAAALRRVRELLERLAASAPLAAVERARFDDSAPGLLRFEAELLVRGRISP